MSNNSNILDLPSSLRVISLNCWGLKFLSKHRHERLTEIGRQIAQASPTPHIVGLQECWTQQDYLAIREITKDVLRFNDDDGKPLVEKILDKAGQKGTGKWTAMNALDLGMPVTLIGEAVFARCLSAIKDERVRAAKVLGGPTPKFEGDKKEFIDNLEQALYASKIISYAQGFMLMQEVRQLLSGH